MELSKCKVLKIPFASKRELSSIIKTTKTYKYKFSGIAYYVFDEYMNIINNKAKILSSDNFARREESTSDWLEKKFSNDRNIILDEETDNNKIINRFNYDIIEKYNLNVGNSVSLITAFNPKGACINSCFNDTQILFYDKKFPKYNGWRFSTILSLKYKASLLSIDGEIKDFKYKKIKKNNSKLFFSFKKLEEMNEISFEEIMEMKEFKRLFTIYNKDLIEKKDWIEYENDINALIKNNSKVYPLNKDLLEVISGVVFKNVLNSNEIKGKDFYRLVSEQRRIFREKMLNNYKNNNNFYDSFFNKYKILDVCEASHFFDVKMILKKINKEIQFENDECLNKIYFYLSEISDENNGLFLDPTTHKYFDKDLLKIDKFGFVYNETGLNDYDNIKILLNEKQKEYIALRNKYRNILVD